jgi:DNA-binding response OmpR family regulator
MDAKGVPNVIIAEDDSDVSGAMRAAFKMDGFVPHQASTAEECLGKVRELGNMLDAIVMNGRIASDRGKMLIVNIKNINRKVKIFVLAERFEEESKTRVLDYGADEFTTKPLSINTLIEKVNMLLIASSPPKS